MLPFLKYMDANICHTRQEGCKATEQAMSQGRTIAINIFNKKGLDQVKLLIGWYSCGFATDTYSSKRLHSYLIVALAENNQI